MDVQQDTIREMAEEKVATVNEVKEKLDQKTAENAVLTEQVDKLKEQVEELKEQLKKFLGEGGVDGLKDKLGKLACGSDDAEGDEKPSAEPAVDIAKKALSLF